MTGGDNRPLSQLPVIGPEQVAHVARLARLGLSEDELTQFTGQLASVLTYAAEISELDVGDLEPMAHPLPLRNVLREDEPRPGLGREAVLAEAPAAEDGRFRVPRILGEEA
jgi:aspartyl-tRNA(Asn)/glutamyl-tRNA(Gln) amidotransferase subunit C